MNTRWWPVVLVAAVVLAFSVVPLGGTASGAVSGVGLDKLLHVIDYAALAFALGYAIRARRARVLLAVFAAAVAFGGAVELLQGPLPTRATSLADAVANAVGAALGTAGWWLLGVGRGRG
ncbi:VanZ family protein [Halolamina sp.]|uniref:VanZ family protein n=1 Tax=Halolamina sp. TaxID=1940283 RepID=UPI000223B9EF|nr:VanZ family protein [halophilic archaeon DL31]